MNRNRTLFLVTLAALALALAGCGESAEVEAAALEAPAAVESIEGTELSRLTLTQRAAERLGLQTAAVEEVPIDEEAWLAVPYSAILYDASGSTWVYTNPEPLVYVRAEIVVDHVDHDLALIADGLTSGTHVVTVGAAELYGAEIGVGGGH